MIVLILILSTTPFRADRVEIVKENGEKIVSLKGNVEIEQDSIKIFCYQAQLNETKGYVLLKDSVLIKDNEGEIRANYAIYYLNEKTSVLSGGVKLIEENQVISADSLDYDAQKRSVKMYHNVHLEERKNKIVAYGNEGWYDLNREVGGIKKNPRVEIARKDKLPIIINAKEFLLKNREELCYGYDSVTAVIDSITLFCDSISFDIKRDSGSMINPVVVEKQNVLKGISGGFGLKDKMIDYFRVYAGSANYWTTDGAHNIIEGDTINILFKDGRAYRVKVEGRPKGRLYLKEKEEGAKD